MVEKVVVKKAPPKKKIGEVKEANRHREANRSFRVDERKLDLMEAGNALKADSDKSRLEQRQREFEAAQQRQQESDAEKQRKDGIALDNKIRDTLAKEDQAQAKKNQQILSGTAKTVGNIAPDNSSFKFGSVDVSWGMVFLILLATFWLTLSTAPSHNSSRLSVIWKSLTGQEEIK